VTEQALAAHDAALATADERRRAAEDARLAELVTAVENAGYDVADLPYGFGRKATRHRLQCADTARAELLAYIETIRK
jgi:hypothetical protein